MPMMETGLMGWAEGKREASKNNEEEKTYNVILMLPFGFPLPHL
jgi:hypothetical protein